MLSRFSQLKLRELFITFVLAICESFESKPPSNSRQMKNLLQRIPSFLKNFYFLATLFFFVWLGFVDSNDLFFQAQLVNKKSELQSMKELYQDKILEVRNDQAALNGNPDLLEKMAREQYLMKKPNEDLYIVVKED